MKIKNIELLSMMQVLNKYSTKKLPQKISYLIVKNALNIQSDVDCYTKMLNKIIETYKDFIVKNDKGEYTYTATGIPQVDDEHMSDYIAEINELLNIEVEIKLSTVDDISIFDYNDDKYDILTPKEIMQLQSILCNKE